MNKKEINDSLKQLVELHDKVEFAVGELIDIAGQITNDLQEFYDDKSEKWQEGEAGQAIEQLISDLNEMADIIIPDVPSYGG